MATKRTNAAAQSPKLSHEEIEAGIRKVERRLEDLRRFDILLSQDELHSLADVLEAKINTTIAELFGDGTPDFNRHAVFSLDANPPTISFGGYHEPPLSEVQKSYQQGVDKAIAKLESLKSLLQERLDDLRVTQSSNNEKSISTMRGNKVFVVHGRNAGLKETVARLISKLGLEPVILHEQPNVGRTIIEKLEQHLAVDFAIVLLTADDVGALTEEAQNLQPRARQNVVLELGLFIGALGRARVCALYEAGVELPSDFDGVAYVPIDSSGAWKFTLAREIKQAGISVDLNLVV